MTNHKYIQIENLLCARGLTHRFGFSFIEKWNEMYVDDWLIFTICEILLKLYRILEIAQMTVCKLDEALRKKRKRERQRNGETEICCIVWEWVLFGLAKGQKNRFMRQYYYFHFERISMMNSYVYWHQRYLLSLILLYLRTYVTYVYWVIYKCPRIMYHVPCTFALDLLKH